MTLDFLSPLHPRHFGVPAALWDVAQNYAEAYAAEQVAAELEACEAIAQDICDQIMYGEPDPECVGPDDGLNTTELGQLNAAMVIRDAIRARAQEE